MDYSDSQLIVRLPNWIGDAVMALPVVHALQDKGIQLQLLGKPWINDLLAATELPLFTLEKKFSQTKNKIAQIPTKRILLLTNSFSSALLARLAGKEVIGYKTDHRQLLLKRSLKPSTQIHEIEYFWNIAGFALRYWFPNLSWPEVIPEKINLPLDNKALLAAKKILNNKGITQPFWVLCPFAHGTGANKQSKIWPYWSEFSKQLTQHTTLVCPGPNEEPLCPQLVPESHVLSGLNLGEYAAILSLAEQVIANDSGPMHMAAAVNPNTLGIFGVSNPQRTCPWGADYIGDRDRWPNLSEVMERLTGNN